MPPVVCALVGIATAVVTLPSYSQPNARPDDPTNATRGEKRARLLVGIWRGTTSADGLILMESRLLTVRCGSELASKSKDRTVAAPSL
jgi:hypothetical protein